MRQGNVRSGQVAITDVPRYQQRVGANKPWKSQGWPGNVLSIPSRLELVTVSDHGVSAAVTVTIAVAVTEH